MPKVVDRAPGPVGAYASDLGDTPAMSAARSELRPARRPAHRDAWPRRASRRLVALLAVGVLAPVVAASGADAASYTVWSCRAADGTPVGTTAWQGSGNAGTRSDGCAAGGALRATLGQSDTADGAVSGWRFVPPPGTTIASYRLWRAAEVPATSSGFGAGAAGTSGLGLPTISDGCVISDGINPCGAGSLGNPADPGNDSGVQPGGVPGLTVAALCVSSCTATADPAAEVALFRSAIELEDNAVPVVGPAVGTLFDPGVFAGRHSVLVTVGDQGGGVARTDLLIDGVVVDSATTGGSCAEPYAVVVPCATRTDRAFVVDTSALAPGLHGLTVRAVDAAGNATEGPVTPFVVVPLPVPVPPPPPVIPTQRTMMLELPEEVSTPRKDWGVGTAQWADGSPAAGAKLDVYAGPVGGAASELEWLTRITVDPDGTFTIPKSSFSRALRIQPADATHVAAPVDVDVVAPLKVRMTKPRTSVRNGTTTTLRGRISGAGDAVDGMTVLVQAVVDGGWSTVDTVEASASGAVSWKYRFRRTTRAAEYRFRLVVPSVRKLPWKRTASPRQVVRVVPRASR